MLLSGQQIFYFSLLQYGHGGSLGEYIMQHSAFSAEIIDFAFYQKFRKILLVDDYDMAAFLLYQKKGIFHIAF